MKLVAMPGLTVLALAVFAAAPARATVYDFTQLPLHALGLNDLDQIVGYAPYFQSILALQAEIYDHGAVTYPLAGLGSSGFSTYLTAINNTGLVLYQESSGNFGSTGEFQNGSPPKILLSMMSSRFYAVNNKGDIVGGFSNGSAIINGQQVRVSVPSQYLGVFNETITTGINDADQIVGYFIPLISSSNPDIPPNYIGQFQGFLLSGGVYTAFTAPGSMATSPVAINNSDEIVGTYTDAAGGEHGFEEENNVFTTIVGPNGSDFLPSGLNNLGQIVGTNSQGSIAYLATPQAVPEPSTLALLCAGLTGLLGWRSWSRR